MESRDYFLQGEGFSGKEVEGIKGSVHCPLQGSIVEQLCRALHSGVQ